MARCRVFLFVWFCLLLTGSAVGKRKFEWKKPQSPGEMQRKFWAAEADKFAVTIVPLRLVDPSFVNRCALSLPRKFTAFKLYVANAGPKSVKFRQGLPSVVVVLDDGTKLSNVDFRHFLPVGKPLHPDLDKAFQDIDVGAHACESTLICFPKIVKPSDIEHIHYGMGDAVELQAYVYPTAQEMKHYAIMMPKGM